MHAHPDFTLQALHLLQRIGGLSCLIDSNGTIDFAVPRPQRPLERHHA